MGVKVHIPADEVWSFFQKNKDRCSGEMIAIAENTDTEYVVYLTEEDGYPLFSVCKGDDEPEYEEGAISVQDCTDTAKHCYMRYLLPVVVGNDETAILEEDEELARQDIEDIMYEREDELRLALCEFLQVVLQEGKDGVDVMDIYGTAMVDEALDDILEYIATELRLDVYRPTIITDAESGCEIYTEYPYDPNAPYEEYGAEIEDDSTMIYGGGWE